MIQIIRKGLNKEQKAESRQTIKMIMNKLKPKTSQKNPLTKCSKKNNTL